MPGGWSVSHHGVLDLKLATVLVVEQLVLSPEPKINPPCLEETPFRGSEPLIELLPLLYRGVDLLGRSTRAKVLEAPKSASPHSPRPVGFLFCLECFYWKPPNKGVPFLSRGNLKTLEKPQNLIICGPQLSAAKALRRQLWQRKEPKANQPNIAFASAPLFGLFAVETWPQASKSAPMVWAIFVQSPLSELHST